SILVRRCFVFDRFTSPAYEALRQGYYSDLINYLQVDSRGTAMLIGVNLRRFFPNLLGVSVNLSMALTPSFD
ncbi:MAG: hypothetical protein ACYTXA_09765, partial [Nostoc sp.]